MFPQKGGILPFLYKSKGNDVRKFYTAEAVMEGHRDKFCLSARQCGSPMA